MTAELVELIQTCVGVLLIQAVTMSVALYVMCLLCKFRGSLLGLSCYFIFKTVFVNNVMGIIGEHYWGEKTFYSLLYFVVVLVFFLLNMFVFCTHFEGGFLRVMTVEAIAEAFSAPAGLVVVRVLGSLEGQQRFWQAGNERAVMANVLLMIAAGGVYGIFFYVAAPYLRRFQNAEIRHPGIMKLCLGVYLSACFISMFGELKMKSLMVPGSAAVIIIMCCAYLFYQYQQHVRRQHQFLIRQQKLLEIHYKMMQEQFSQMEESVELLREQQSRIMNLEGGAGNDRIAAYLEELRRQYQGIVAGGYCDDRLIDAVLCYQAGVCKRKQIAADFAVQKYDRGMIDERDLMQLLMQVLEYGIRECLRGEKDGGRTLRLRASAVKNQLVIELTCGGGRRKMPMSAVKECVKKYRGSVRQRRNGEMLEVVIMMDRGKRG